MFLRIEILPEKRLIGQRMKMSFAENKTFQLWSKFMPRRKEIKSLSPDLYSMQVYDILYSDLNFTSVFEKWAAVEVGKDAVVPIEMEEYKLSGGLYAVFLHKGPPGAFQNTFDFIFKTWIPGSAYELDNREHFEILGEKYKNNHPDSEEEIWIPIIPRTL